MKRLWFIPILIVELLLLSYAFGIANNKGDLISWQPVCRHNAVFWSSVVRDQGFPVRFMFGRIYDTENWKDADGLTTYTWHVQPQVQLGEVWYYFKVENDKVVIMNMPTNWKKEWHMLPKDYVDWLFSIQRDCE